MLKPARKLTFISIVIVLSILSMLVFPITVLADDSTPPPTDTPEVLPPTEEPVVTDESVTATSTPEPVSDNEVPGSDLPAGDDSTGGEETSEVDLSQIIQEAAENDITLSDPTGEALQLVTTDAAEALTAGDPYFTSGGILYAFTFADCDPLTPGPQPCSTPIQAALNLAQTRLPDLLISPDGQLRRTIYVEPATYNEQLTINTGGLTLWGNPGDLTVPGADAAAPILDGSTWASGDTGVTINAEGVTLIGFIIQNYQRAVSQPIVVGSNTVVITQNTIQNNGEGIVILSDQGSPGTDVTYNVFKNNSSFDLVNGAPNDNNVQFVDAPNNYWGCATGPVVAYRIFTGSGNNRTWTGQWGYIDWATKYDYGVNGAGLDPNPACAILYGSDELFDFQINTSAYSPYKINIGSFFSSVGNPSLSITKTASPTTYDSVGDVISYSYVVTNTGNVTLAGPVTVADNKTTVTCPAGGLAPAASMTCTASYTITQADLDAGSVTNTARASADGTDSNQASATVTAVKNPGLSIVKTATPTTYSAVGQVISYSYLVTNTGNVTITGPFVVSDDKSTDEKCPLTLALAPGASITCTASYTITQADLDAGSVTNIASATNGSVTSPTDSETVTAVQTSALTIVKTAAPTTYSAVGQVINYNYLVTNASNITLNGPFTVTDNKTSTTCPATPSLAPGTSMICTASYTITQADLDTGSVTNIASATNGTVTSPNDSETVTAIRNSALTIVKTATPTTYSAVGQVISYSYLVTNASNITLNGPFSVTDDKANVTCPTTASLAPGASITCTASYTVAQADLNSGSVTNIASATNGTVTSPTDSETVTAVQSAALTIVKTASPGTYNSVGNVINYSYLVTNTGNVTLTGPFSVNDDKASVSCPATANLAPSASITCTASHTISQADLDAGSVTNVASATNGVVTSPSDSETVTAVQRPALAIVKTATPATYDSVGNVISYSYLVTNTGNVTLSGPFTVNDNKAAVNCPATASLAPGASLTCTASYIITQADLNAGSVTNVASATNGVVTSPSDSETVTAVQRPALTIVKTASPGTYDSVGDVINYSYLVTNTGNVILAGPFTVTDDKATVTCPATASLAPGASITCNASYTVTQTDLNSGSVTNIASATNGTVTSPTDSETVTAVQSPALTIIKNASPGTYDAVGDIINYSYLVTNTGNITLSGPFTVNDNKATVTCPATASLAPGASITCSASYTITQADLNAGSVTNIASATNGTVTSPTDSETVNAVQNTGLTILKTATPATYSAVGQVINYSYLVTNSSNIALNGPFTVTDNKATVTCPATASLNPGSSITCTATYTITQADLDAGSVTNLAFASNGTVTSPTDSETVTAVQRSSLTIGKTASPGTYDSVGDIINYSYLVTNTGNVTLAGPVTVTDDKAAVTCPAGGLAPGASMTCTASYAITQADLDTGSVTNIAFAASGNVTSPTDSETVTAAQNPALTILKTATPTTYSSVGQVINYSYLVTNTGNVTLAGPFTVTDDKATVTCPAGGLAPGASLTCTASYTVTQADLNSGSVTNIAFATSGNVTSPTDSETVTANQNPSLSIVKTVTSTGSYGVEDTITYSIVVTNTGNVTLTGVTVNDNNAVMGSCAPAQPSTLAPGASMTCSASHVITPADVESGSYVNTATGDSDQTAPTTSTVTVNFAPAPPTTPPTDSTPARPSPSFTGFIPVTGGETHAIAAGIAHTCAIMPDGGIQCWGNNDFGQLGDGTNTGSNVPVDVVGIGGGTTIVAGGNHTCVLVEGEVWCWGRNDQGQLGDGTRTDRNIPVKVLSGVVDITAGLDYTCAVMLYGQVMCWGNNDLGQLADGTRVDQTKPTLAALITSISNIDAGRIQSCGLTGSGLLRCVNRGTAQDLGGFIPVTGDAPEATLDVAVNRFGPLVMALLEEGMPVEFLNGQFNAIDDVTDAIDVDSGLGHVCALVENGTVSCWGSNNYGQLGRNTLTSSQDPQSVLNVSNAWQLAVGRNHACVLIISSTPGTNDIQCWGLNTDGQLGNGTYENSAVPVYVK